MILKNDSAVPMLTDSIAEITSSASSAASNPSHHRRYAAGMKPATQHGRADNQGEDRVGWCGLEADDGQQQQADGDRHLIAHEDEAHDRQRRDTGDSHEQRRRRRLARKQDGQRERD